MAKGQFTCMKMHVSSALRKTVLAKSFEAEAEAAKAKANGRIVTVLF